VLIFAKYFHPTETHPFIENVTVLAMKRRLRVPGIQIHNAGNQTHPRLVLWAYHKYQETLVSLKYTPMLSLHLTPVSKN